MNIEVILGKKLKFDGRMTQELVKRLELGIKTYNEVHPDFIVVSGGRTGWLSFSTEAGHMAHYLAKHGIPHDKILVEKKSLTTTQNAQFVSDMFLHQAIQKIYLVSTKYHFERKLGLSCLTIFKNKFPHSEIIPIYKE